MAKEILKLENVGKSFSDGSDYKVLENINITVNEGEFVCFLGPSGCGKTVLLRLIAGFIEPTAGKILIDNKVAGLPGKDRIIIFQDYVLFPWMTVYGNIIFGLEKSSLSKEEKKVLADRYMEIIGLTKFKDWHVHNLSGGMKQRVAIARALISDPKILLMDEPFAALDSQNRKYMRRNLEEVWQKTKKTIIFVTHSINEAVELSDTIYLFSSYPAKVKKIYHLNMPRPRSRYSKEFEEISNDVEREISEEFKKDSINDLALKK